MERTGPRGGRLSALPKSRLEFEAVGDVVLVGGEATEAKLKQLLATQRRWRAVHLACHGLVDPDRPVFSSLALTPSGPDDGFLTCYEILGLSIPADLVVLAACDTGTGALYRGEGIIGLTRAFMYAGASRVLCSQWRADEDASRALMVRFYELWNPKPAKGDKPTKGSKPAKAAEAPQAGLPAEEALRQAQAWVRSHKKWEHPYYWAAWVLWGLPDA